MKKVLLAAFAVLLCASLCACGASDSTLYAATDSQENSYSANGTYDGGLYYEKSESISDSESGNYEKKHEEKLVYTSYVTLETEVFEDAMQSLHSRIESLGGIIINETAYNLNSINRSDYRSLNLTVRIPQENYRSFLDGLSENYNVASVQNTVDNMTEAYYDNDNRLKSYQIQEQRLLEMMEAATTVTDMLEIESRLCDVQYQIESLTNTQRGIDTDVKYATFHITLDEVTRFTTPAPVTFGERLGETVKGSVDTFKEVATNLLFLLIYLLPYILIIAVIVAVILICANGAKKKRIKRASTQNAPDEQKKN